MYVLILIRFTSTLIVGDWKDFMSKWQIPGFWNPFNLSEYFQNKDIDPNKTL